jgi:hypothetical protein
VRAAAVSYHLRRRQLPRGIDVAIPSSEIVGLYSWRLACPIDVAERAAKAQEVGPISNDSPMLINADRPAQAVIDAVYVAWACLGQAFHNRPAAATLS